MVQPGSKIPHYGREEEDLIWAEGEKGEDTNWADLVVQLSRCGFPDRKESNLKRKYDRMMKVAIENEMADYSEPEPPTLRPPRRRGPGRGGNRNRRRVRVGQYSARNQIGTEEEAGDSEQEYDESDSHAELPQSYTMQVPVRDQAQAGQSIFNLSQSTSTLAAETPELIASPAPRQPDRTSASFRAPPPRQPAARPAATATPGFATTCDEVKEGLRDIYIRLEQLSSRVVDTMKENVGSMSRRCDGLAAQQATQEEVNRTHTGSLATLTRAVDRQGEGLENGSRSTDERLAAMASKIDEQGVEHKEASRASQGEVATLKRMLDGHITLSNQEASTLRRIIEEQASDLKGLRQHVQQHENGSRSTDERLAAMASKIDEQGVEHKEASRASQGEVAMLKRMLDGHITLSNQEASTLRRIIEEQASDLKGLRQHVQQHENGLSEGIHFLQNSVCRKVPVSKTGASSVIVK